MTLDEFRELRPLHTHFPVVFDSGARWEVLTGHCGSCQEPFSPDNLRGTVTHPFPKVFVVEALGYCPECRRLTPIQYRLHSDMAITGKSPRTGDWARWEPRKSFWRWLKSLF